MGPRQRSVRLPLAGILPPLRGALELATEHKRAEVIEILKK